MPDPHDEIADLESQIEGLYEAAERCARMMLAAKAATGAGVVLLALTTIGLIRFTPLMFVIAITVVLGGIALFGSTRSSRDQIIATIRMREAERGEIINRLELRQADVLTRRPSC